MPTPNFEDLLSRIERLEKAVFAEKSIKSPVVSRATGNKKLDFSMNGRAFVNTYATKKSGPKKFTLLLAYIAKGDEAQEIPLNQISKMWSKMKGKNMLGQFNMFYVNYATTKGWVTPKKYGSYSLTNNWKEILA